MDKRWMNKAFGIFIFTLLFCLIFGRCVIFLERKKAMEAGVGRYETNPKTGTVEFKYGRFE